MNILRHFIVVGLVTILISGTVPQIWASVSFSATLPMAGNPINPTYDFEKSFYLDYPAGSKLQSLLQNKNVTIEFADNSNDNPDIKALMAEINNYILTSRHSAATFTDLAVDYKLFVNGYSDHTSFDYKIILTPTVTNYVLNKASGDVPATIDASWMTFSIVNPININTKQYGILDINSPLNIIQSQMPDVYGEIQGTEASHVFNSSLLDATRLFNQQPLDKWDSLFDPAYTLSETAGYGYQGQKVAVTTYSSGLSNTFSGTLHVNNVDEDFTGLDGIKYHISTKEDADAGIINVEGHANVNQIQGGWTFTTTAQATAGISSTTAGGLSTMTIYAVAGFAATLGATLFWWTSKPRKNSSIESKTSSTNQNEQYTTITIEGLKKTYRLDEPIEFTVLIKGYDNDIHPFIYITKDPGEEKVWSQAYVSPKTTDSPPFDVDMKLHIPSKENPIAIKEKGSYTVFVSITHNFIKEIFEIL